MKMTRFLAILVVATMCLLQGCGLAFGPQDCEFGSVGFACAPNPDATSVDGSYGGDGYSSPETTTDGGAETSQANVCKTFLWLDGSKWLCHVGSSEEDCVLRVFVHTDGACWVATTPLLWGKPAAALTFSKGQLGYEYDGVKYTCDYKSN